MIFFKMGSKVSVPHRGFLDKITSAAKPPVAPQAPEFTPKNCAPTPSVRVDPFASGCEVTE